MSTPVKNIGYVPEVEQMLLGSLLFGGDVRQVSSFLRADHFINDLHRLIYTGIQTAFERFGSSTVPVVNKVLPSDATELFMQQTGKSPSGYMAELSSAAVMTSANLSKGARNVMAQWARIKAGEVAGQLQVASTDHSADAEKMISTFASDLDVISSEMRAGPRRKTRLTIQEAATNAFDAAKEARQRGNGLTGITWGLADVNRLTGGVQRRDLTLIGARPSMGKTSVGLSCAIKMAKSGAGVGFISLEMDAAKLAARGVSDIAFDWSVRIPYTELINGKVSDEQIEHMESATRDINKLPLIIEDQSGLSIADIRIKTEAMMAEFEAKGTPMGVLMIDHLGLIRANSRYSGNRVQEISEMTAALKTMAREYDLAVVVLSQLSRAVENRDNKRPQLSDLRDSGSIEQDADTIILLYREEYYLRREKASGERETERLNRLIECKNKLEFHIAKQRNGPVEMVDLFLDVACSAVRNGARL